MVDANVPDIALEPDKTVKKVYKDILIFPVSHLDSSGVSLF